MIAARFIQAGFLTTSAAFLAIIFLGIGGLTGMAIALFLTMPFAAIIMFGMKCASCGVSYFYEPSKGGGNITGVNMLRPVSKRCPKCGNAR
ncbi:MAG: hypothetical protein ABS86_05475 [Sphingobium sp. SCN 64-10]|nr:MAG: hypothetical protein ABS86_05475 [Sphingobium sp. SCN 64-10]